MTIYEDRITTSEGTVTLTPEVSATGDTAGNLAVTKRVTLTRLVGGGIIGGLLFQKKQKHDSRELYLLVETPDYASVTQSDPNDGPKVRELAAKINTAARNAANVVRLRKDAIESAKRELERVRSDKSGVERAKANARQTESNTAAVDEARSELAEIQSDTAEVDKRRIELSRLSQSTGQGVTPP